MNIMIVETIMEQLVGSDTMDLLMDMLEEKSTDFAADRQRCADAVKKLQGAMLEPSVDDAMEAIFEQASVTFLFSLCLGLKDNLDHFMNPIARTFLEVDSESYIRTGVIRQLPRNLEAQAVRRRFVIKLSEEQQKIYEDIAIFIAHLETAIPKLAHYYGYLLGNELYLRIVPGYYPDIYLTKQYRKKLEDDLEIEMGR
jgi:hypothetical protein